MKSEFGRGLVICLVKFAEHFERGMISNIVEYDNYLKIPKKSRCLKSDKNVKWWMNTIVPIWKSEERALSHEISTFMGGASDHLYEINVPEGKEWDNIRKKVKILKEKGIEIGHSLMGNNIWTTKDVWELFDLTREIALMIDRKLGLKPNIGEF